MQRNRPLSTQAISVLRALAAEQSRWRYGYDLAAEVHLTSGSLYPILVRLADRGLLEATWEPGPEGRPPRACATPRRVRSRRVRSRRVRSRRWPGRRPDPGAVYPP